MTSLNQNSDAEITGLELDMLWAITPNLVFSLSSGYLDTEISSFLSVDTANPNASPESVLASNPLAATEGVPSVNGVNFMPGPMHRDSVANADSCTESFGFLQDLSGNRLRLSN